jgi:hypothetical protein
VKVTAAANEVFKAWRDGDNDDLVLALAIAAWQAERCPPSIIPFDMNKMLGRPGVPRW